MVQVEVSPRLASSLVDFLSTVTLQSVKQHNYVRSDLKSLMTKFSTAGVNDNGNIKLKLSKREGSAFAGLITSQAQNIWDGMQLEAALKVKDSLPTTGEAALKIPAELQALMQNQGYAAFDACRQLLNAHFSELMPPAPWIPAYRTSFAAVRKQSTVNWTDSGFYHNGGISLAMAPIVSWMGTANQYFWEPKAYSEDSEIGSFTVSSWAPALWAEMARCYSQLICVYAYKTTKQKYFRGRSSKGFQDMYRMLRVQLINPTLIEDNRIIGLKRPDQMNGGSGLSMSPG